MLVLPFWLSIALVMSVDAQTKLLFVRHGESLANVNPDIRFQSDYSDHNVALSPRGREQATSCKCFFSERLYKAEADRLKYWSSPMRRAIETAHIIVPTTAIDNIVVDADLREMEWPRFETQDERAHHKAGIKAHGMFRYKKLDSKAETGEDVAKRLTHFLMRHKQALNDQTNIIFCHELVMRAFQYLVRRDPTVFDTIEYDNCEVAVWTGSLDALVNMEI